MGSLCPWISPYLLLSRIVLLVKQPSYGLVSTRRHFLLIFLRELVSCFGKCSQKMIVVREAFLFVSVFVFSDECIYCGCRWRRVTQISRRITWRGSHRGSHGGCGDPIRMLKENFSGQEEFCGPPKNQY